MRFGRIHILILLSLWVCFPLSAAKQTVKTHIKSWQLADLTSIADTVPVDTSFLNTPMRSVINDFSISNVWNGNYVSPVQSRLWFLNQTKVDDVFGSQYQPYTITPQDVQFYNTTVPYSKIGYNRSFQQGHEEHEINFLFTGNINKRINLGAEINYLKGYGHYASQEGKMVNGAVFGSYDGDVYSLHAGITFNTLSNFENGGIQRLEDLSTDLLAEDIPTRLQGMSGYKYISGFLHHGYHLCIDHKHTEKIEHVNGFGEKEMVDTVIVEKIPMMSFMHTFETTNSIHRYIEQQAQQGYFPGIYHNPNQTHDSTNVLTIRNTVSVTFEESFNTKLRFGAMVYARNECQRFLIPLQDGGSYNWAAVNNPFETMDPTKVRLYNDTLFQDQWTNNTFVGGAIYKKQGRFIFYEAGGDVCLVGYKLGQFHVRGQMDAVFKAGKDTMDISAKVRFGNEAVPYYLQHFHSNHFVWNNDFTKPLSLKVEGGVKYPTQWVKPAVNIGFENRTNHIYFEAYDGLPHQMDGNIQVFSADVQCDITTPWVNLENHVVYQTSSSREIPVPMFTLYHNLYYHGTWFKALDAQMGVDMRYFTKYNSPVLNPATGQFCIQPKEQEMAIGNYPVLDVYANFYVRLLHLKFFAQYSHFNYLFMRQTGDYMTMPYYPMGHDMFRAGLVWHFYR